MLVYKTFIPIRLDIRGGLMMKKRTLFTFLLLFFSMTFISCASTIKGSFINTNNNNNTEAPNADVSLRAQTAGSYLIDCYDSGGGSYFKHLVVMTKGDLSGGSYTQYQAKYSDRECLSKRFVIKIEASFNYGAVEAVDGDDAAFSDSMMLDTVLVTSPKMNITVSRTSITVFDETAIPSLESTLGIEIPAIDTEVLISEEQSRYYTHAYFPEDLSSVTIAPFMPAATDYRANFVDDGFVVGIKQ